MYITNNKGEQMHTNHPEVIRLAQKAFPDYKGKKFQVIVVNGPINVCSYWDGGSRNFYKFMRLDIGETMEVPQQSAFDPKIKGADAVSLVPGLVCVEHSFSCGKDMGITIMVHSENAPRLIDQTKPELSQDEKIVLCFTRSLKSSYAGISNYRFHEASRAKGITLNQWETAKQSLIDKGLLNKAGALTIDGKNAAAGLDRYSV
jgi:hypothetical protein